jgi:hypothetical protein
MSQSWTGSTSHPQGYNSDSGYIPSNSMEGTTSSQMYSPETQFENNMSQSSTGYTSYPQGYNSYSGYIPSNSIGGTTCSQMYSPGANFERKMVQNWTGSTLQARGYHSEDGYFTPNNLTETRGNQITNPGHCDQAEKAKFIEYQVVKLQSNPLHSDNCVDKRREYQRQYRAQSAPLWPYGNTNQSWPGAVPCAVGNQFDPKHNHRGPSARDPFGRVEVEVIFCDYCNNYAYWKPR